MSMTRPPYVAAYEPPPLPPISLAAELALLLRVLANDYGYRDLRAGHITVAQPDGTLLINPRELCWPEVRASDIVTIDTDGYKLDGRFNPTIAYGIHLALRRLRPDLGVIIHNHPRWAMVWADCLRVPPIYDQTSASIPHELHLVDEYEGTFVGADESESGARAFGDAEWALLANHGVLITAPSIGHAFMRAYTLEWRCQRAWEVQQMGGGRELSAEVALAYGRHFEPMGPSWWEAAMRIELQRDPSVLD
ncbi:MAG: class II aldolase/adducin family protein [Acidimicrobiia bacterium]